MCLKFIHIISLDKVQHARCFLVTLKMALGFRLKSKTLALAGRSTEGQTCSSHFKHNESLNLTQTHWVSCLTQSVTAHKGNLWKPGGSGLGQPRRDKLLLFFHIWMLEENFPRSCLILVHLRFIRHQNVKTHSGSGRLTTKLAYDWFTAMWKQNTFKNLLRKKKKHCYFFHFYSNKTTSS